MKNDSEIIILSLEDATDDAHMSIVPKWYKTVDMLV